MSEMSPVPNVACWGPLVSHTNPIQQPTMPRNSTGKALAYEPINQRSEPLEDKQRKIGTRLISLDFLPSKQAVLGRKSLQQQTAHA